MAAEWIVVSGAREHNLQDISVRIPRNRLTVITGLSGSGKSSLAFDTLYAEGQRKYVESLSAYARQFLEQMQKPDVDLIEGLSPAISIEQRTAGANPRSIVATTTEIHDFLRLLYASVGRAHCYTCGDRIERQSAEEMVEQLMRLPEPTRLLLLAPMVRGRKGRHDDVFEDIQREGFVRARVDGEIRELDDLPAIDPKQTHSIEAVVDRLVINDKVRSRLTDSVEMALKKGQGTLIALVQTGKDQWEARLYSEKNACLRCGISFDELTPRHFSFNSPYGACPTCHGLGNVEELDPELVAPDPSLPLDDGAIVPWRRGGKRLVMYYKKWLRAVAAHYGHDPGRPFGDLPESFRGIILHGSGDEPISFRYLRGGKHIHVEKPFEGVLPNLRRRYEESESEATRQRLRSFMSRQECPACRGARLRPESLACRVGGRSILELTRLSVDGAAAFFADLALTAQEQAIVGEVIKEIRTRLGFMREVGLGYLTLDRASGTLSGGEAQRIRLATQLGAGLVGVMYVLDEPSIGLHQRDNERLLRTLQRLRDLGNTVIVVEHDEQTIREADYVIDLGPGAGRHGGKVTYQGDAAGLLAAGNSLTARYLRGEAEIRVPPRRRVPENGSLRIVGATENNLQNVDVEIPLGLMVCVTGVSGSGKSTLVDTVLRRALDRHLRRAKDRPGAHRALEGVEHVDKAVVIDQAPIGRTPRSNPATYVGAFSLIRDLFAKLPSSKVRGYGPGRYSFNVKGGRCERCRGDGMLRIEMHFLPDVYVRCEQCRGQRYNRETLQVKYKGKSIAEVLNLTVDEALEFFQAVPGIERKFRTLSEVGLGYLRVGQSATTLSGGEAQRLKLASELSRTATGRTIYLLDEPTTGLHFADVQRLLQVLNRLRDRGNTLVIIEHNLDVIKMADWVIDLGPEGGSGGGRIVVEGTPEDVALHSGSYTGRFLAPLIGDPCRNREVVV